MTQRPIFQRLYDYFFCRYGRAPEETLSELMDDVNHSAPQAVLAASFGRNFIVNV